MTDKEAMRAEFEKWYDSAPEVEFHPGWSLYKDTAYLAFLAGRSSLADAGQVRRAALEEAAKYLEAQATCPCNGDAGYCMENDPPRAYAKEIRALSTTQPKDTPCPPIGEEVWRDIESAPKDGTFVLLCDVERYSTNIIIAGWHTVLRQWRGQATPSGKFTLWDDATHWMPLPQPPQANAPVRDKP